MMEKISPMEVKQVKILTESKEVDSIMNCIEKLGLDVEKIGEGGNAEVFSVEGDNKFSKFCLKRIREKPQIADQDIDREHEFQMRVKKAGIRTPMSLISFNSAKGSYLIMEKVNGYTVREISVKPSLLPDSFELSLFENELKDMIKKMHDSGIVHRDLNSGNIMVNNEGRPVIIDFGTATEGTASSDFAYEESVLLLNPQTNKYEQKSGFFIDDNLNIKNTIMPSIRSAYMARQGLQTVPSVTSI